MTSLQLENCSMNAGSVAHSGKSCRWNIQCRGRRWPQALSTRNPGDWPKGVSQVGRSKSTGALVHRDDYYEVLSNRFEVQIIARADSPVRTSTHFASTVA